MLRASALLLFIMGLVKIVGAIQQAALAALFGPGPALDAYAAVTGLSNLLITFMVLGPVGLALVPAVAQSASGGPGGEGGDPWPLVNAALSATIMALIPLITLGLLGAPLLARMVGPGFSYETMALARTLLLFIIPAMALGAINALLRGVHNGLGAFGTPASAFLLSGLMLLGCTLLLSAPLGIYSAGAGLLLGAGSALAIQLLALRLRGLPIKLASWHHPHLLPLVRKVGLIGLAFVAVESVGLMARIVASGLVPGSVALLDYALSLDRLLGGSIAATVATAALPTLARSAREGRVQEEVSHLLGLTALGGFPITTLMVGLRWPLIQVWLERGHFGPGASQILSSLILVLAPAFIGWAFLYPLLYTFYIIGKARSAAIICVVVALIAPPSLLFAQSLWGLTGDAWAISILTAGTILALGFALLRELPHLLDIKHVGVGVLWLLLSIAAAFGAGRATLGPSPLVQLVLGGAAGTAFMGLSFLILTMAGGLLFGSLGAYPWSGRIFQSRHSQSSSQGQSKHPSQDANE